jgi:phosphotransferase system enzyme I (PtsI)
MIILKGIAASPGIEAGTAFVVAPADDNVFERRTVAPDKTEWEVSRYNAAVAKTLEDIEKNERKTLELFGADYAKIIKAHVLILKDPVLNEGVIQRIVKERVNAEYALYETMREINANFENIKDELFRERKFDIIDVVKTLSETLTRHKRNRFPGIKDRSIIVAHNLFPSDTLNLKELNVLGFATDCGGKTGHTAILARSMRMPAVVGLCEASSQIKTGESLILDGERGLLIIRPSPQTVVFYKKEREKFAKTEKSLRHIAALPNQTKDGRALLLCVNYDPRKDFKEWDGFTSDGIGLMRTEFIYMDRSMPPCEEEQRDIYVKSFERFGARPCTIRLADLGGDKAFQFGLCVRDEEDNPFMGCRGIRLFLKYPALLKTQLRAIIAAAARVKSPIKIMVPMVSCVEEMKSVKRYFKKAVGELKLLGIIPKSPIEIGAMIEVPSAALTLDIILPEVDFISIGTNDLVQYLLAVDRGNREVADIYDPYHPAVLRTLSCIIQAARKHGKLVSVCGEIASDPDVAPFLIGLGVDMLSVSPGMFLRIKNVLINLNFENCQNIAQAALLKTSAAEIRKLNE